MEDDNSRPTRIPNLRCSEEENYSCKQLNYEEAQLWNNATVRGVSDVRWPWNEVALGWGPSLAIQLCSSSLHSVLLHSCETSSTFNSRQRNAVFCGKGKWDLWVRGELTYRERSSPLVPDWFILMQMRTPNPHSMIDPKKHCLDCLEWSCSGWWRC